MRDFSMNDETLELKFEVDDVVMFNADGIKEMLCFDALQKALLNIGEGYQETIMDAVATCPWRISNTRMLNGVRWVTIRPTCVFSDNARSVGREWDAYTVLMNMNDGLRSWMTNKQYTNRELVMYQKMRTIDSLLEIIA